MKICAALSSATEKTNRVNRAYGSVKALRIKQTDSVNVPYQPFDERIKATATSIDFQRKTANSASIDNQPHNHSEYVIQRNEAFNRKRYLSSEKMVLHDEKHSSKSQR